MTYCFCDKHDNCELSDWRSFEKEKKSKYSTDSYSVFYQRGHKCDHERITTKILQRSAALQAINYNGVNGEKQIQIGQSQIF